MFDIDHKKAFDLIMEYKYDGYKHKSTLDLIRHPNMSINYDGQLQDGERGIPTKGYATVYCFGDYNLKPRPPELIIWAFTTYNNKLRYPVNGIQPGCEWAEPLLWSFFAAIEKDIKDCRLAAQILKDEQAQEKERERKQIIDFYKNLVLNGKVND